MADQATLWPLRVNWRGRWEETIEFLTEVIRSEDGHEQRRARRNNPRLAYEFNSMSGGDAAHAALARLGARQGEQFIFPHALEPATLSGAITAGGTGFALSSIPAWWAPGQHIVITNGERSELAVAASNVALTAPAEQSWPVGSKVRLGVPARFDGGTDVRFRTTRAAEAGASFRAELGEGYLPDTSGVVFSQTNGRDLFLLRPNWASSLSLAFTQDRDTIDFGYGAWADFVRADFVERTLKARFTLKNASERQRMLARFLRSKGRRGSFYMPNWIQELKPIDTQPGFMRFDGRVLFDLFDGDLAHKRIYVRGTDGSDNVAAITSMSTDGATTVFNLDTDLSGVNAAWVGWLLRWRFFTDALTLEWLTDAVAEVNVTFYSLEDGG